MNPISLTRLDRLHRAGVEVAVLDSGSVIRNMSWTVGKTS